jgi:hypothetical protein
MRTIVFLALVIGGYVWASQNGYVDNILGEAKEFDPSGLFEKIGDTLKSLLSSFGK